MGLSVLAGIFFVVATVDLVGEIFLAAGFAAHLVPGFDPGWLPPVLSAEYLRTAPAWYLALGSVVLWPVKIGLLIAAAFAFQAQRRRGRLLTNIYVVVSLIESIATARAFSFTVAAFVAIMYLVLVFLLVNKVFAEDLKY